MTNTDVRAEKVGECKEGGGVGGPFCWMLWSVECGAWSVEHGGKIWSGGKNLSVSFTRELWHMRGMKLH